MKKADVVPRQGRAGEAERRRLRRFTNLNFNNITDNSAVSISSGKNQRADQAPKSTLAGKLVPQIEAVMASDAKKTNPLSRRPMFYYDHELDLQKGQQVG